MVDDVAATIDAVLASGGQLVQPVGVDAPEITARFRDPAGNVIGLYHQPAVKPETKSASKSAPKVARKVARKATRKAARKGGRKKIRK
jgi:hypothetical protein